MMESESEMAMQPLTLEEIRNLNSSNIGRGLKEDRYYVKAFVINARPNKAADPAPFQIASAALDKIASTVVGRPFVVWYRDDRHIRGASAEQILQLQSKWSVGEF